MSYDAVQGGRLKLKKQSAMGVQVEKKKKKKKKKLQVLPPDSPPSKKEGKEEEEEEEWEPKEPVCDIRTDAEKRFDRIQREREEKKIKSQAEKSYKEKMKNLNDYLDRLPQHFDIPKVGPG
eukprot:CAMPEP_0201488428 /NCGR_PEP_ID=MMETSP0151_2-20130828/18162_1 /ASSEMBLY_ACC=CAM_ASM_000257 /TAXON_ID=200890 /ORGANISM="Paramoeba atlantica, Strain 621/1 / CCAP 1560/9" /LENGTH=120 /DNA_ID=CAMNT_0047873715 /DNA_START=21 /DNA_END=383 /DNA_ORIENTATION=-